VATSIIMSNGETFRTEDKVETVIQNLERRSYTEIRLEDGRAILINPLHVVYVVAS
jgi:hypothetical protein